MSRDSWQGRRAAIVAIVLVAAIASFGHGVGAAGGSVGQIATPPAAPGATPDETTTLAFLNPYPDDAYWRIVQRAVEERGRDNGVAVDIFALESPSAPDQVAQFETAVASGVDGILVGAIDELGTVPGVIAANQAGVPVVALQNDLVAGNLLTVVRSDDVAAARAAGDFIAERIGGAGVVLNLQGDMASSVARDRDDGLRAAFADYPEIEVLSESAHWTSEEAFAITSELVPSAPLASPVSSEATPVAAETVPRAIFAANAASLEGAMTAVAAAGRDDVLIVGFGSVLTGAEAVDNGEIAAVVAPFPARMGALGVDALLSHLEGEELPPFTDSGFVLVTEENVDDLLPEDDA
jgi:ribose transport system substrate-binding protein